jgi:RNA polymerase sigma-70 factor (ECF subfamily)
MESQQSTRSSVLLQEFLRDPKNPQLIGKFTAKYQPRIKECCRRRRLQDSDADDLTANIVLRFLEGDVFDAFVFQGKAKFNGWLETVVRNAVWTFHRDRGRKPDVRKAGSQESQDGLERAVEELTPAVLAIFGELRAEVDAGFARVRARVAENTWQAFWLVVLEERPVPDVMQRLGMTKVAIWAALSRVRRMLREDLKDLYESGIEEK